jgi:hypothetical protein
MGGFGQPDSLVRGGATFQNLGGDHVINQERVKEAERNVKLYIADGLLKVKDKDAPRFVRQRMLGWN